VFAFITVNTNARHFIWAKSIHLTSSKSISL
jgi:hypothetical protein